MIITATCGPRIPDSERLYTITKKGYTPDDGKRCLIHEVVCYECLSQYRAWGDILDNEAEEQAWVRYEEE